MSFVQVLSRTELEVTLLDGRAWSTGPGALLVTAINTRGDDAGWVTLPGQGVHVAEIDEDLDAVKVRPSFLSRTSVFTQSLRA